MAQRKGPREHSVGERGAGGGFSRAGAQAEAGKEGTHSLGQTWRLMPGGGRCRRDRLCHQATPGTKLGGGRPRELGLNSSPSKLFSAPSSGHRRPKCTREGETDRVWPGAEARAAGLTWSCQARRPGSWVLLDPPAPRKEGGEEAAQPWYHPEGGSHFPRIPQRQQDAPGPFTVAREGRGTEGPCSKRPPGAGRRGGGRVGAGEGPPRL